LRNPVFTVVLSPERRYCTGALFIVDGGFTLGIPNAR
jgi:hypothetical protein